MSETTIAGVVLSGGNSARMGQPKALLTAPDGRAFLRIALDALAAAGASPLCVGGAPAGDAESRAAIEALAAEVGAAVVPDARPDSGPLAGVEATFAALDTEWVLLVACDMPRLDTDLLKAMGQWAGGSEKQAVIPEVKTPLQVETQLQPLHAVYRREPALAAARAALDAGKLSLVAWADGLDAERLKVPENASFSNVNTPEDLEDLR